jgi:hypothetical protein
MIILISFFVLAFGMKRRPLDFSKSDSDTKNNDYAPRNPFSLENTPSAQGQPRQEFRPFTFNQFPNNSFHRPPFTSFTFQADNPALFTSPNNLPFSFNEIRTNNADDSSKDDSDIDEPLGDVDIVTPLNTCSQTEVLYDWDLEAPSNSKTPSNEEISIKEKITLLTTMLENQTLGDGTVSTMEHWSEIPYVLPNKSTTHSNFKVGGSITIPKVTKNTKLPERTQEPLVINYEAFTNSCINFFSDQWLIAKMNYLFGFYYENCTESLTRFFQNEKFKNFIKKKEEVKSLISIFIDLKTGMPTDNFRNFLREKRLLFESDPRFQSSIRCILEMFNTNQWNLSLDKNRYDVANNLGLALAFSKKHDLLWFFSVSQFYEMVSLDYSTNTIEESVDFIIKMVSSMIADKDYRILMSKVLAQ